MRALSHDAIVFVLAVLACGCGSDDEMNPPAGAAGAPAPGAAGTTGGLSAGTAGMTNQSPITGTAGSSPPVSGVAGMGMSPAGGGGAAGTAGTTGSAGMDEAGSGAGGNGVAGAGSDAGAGASAGSDGPGFAQLPHVTTTDGVGPFPEVVKVKNTPPGGWLIYPKDIGRDGIKHPIFVFGPGGGTTPDTYEQMGMHWDRYGSYGFVIYVLPMSTGDGAAMKAGLDWVIEQNEVSSSPLYQHLDTSKVCAAGHSQGSITTFDFMPDDRVTTTIHVSGGSFDGMGPSHLRKDTMFMCAPDSSGDPAKPQCDGDFKNSTVPTFYTVVQGASHLTSARLGWGASIAWMLWHLAGHEEWRKEFLEKDGEFQTGIYQSQIKNW